MGKERTQSRRDFLKATSAMGVAGMAAPLSADEGAKPSKMRVALVGTGNRGTAMWGVSAVKSHTDYFDMVGLCDINAKRVAYANREIGGAIGRDIPTFTNFDEMIHHTKPDTVVVATVDSFHAQYVIRAMELGCDVICEKPFGTTADQCQAMHDAEKRLRRNITVTFNLRYHPYVTETKKLLMSGEIGDIHAVQYQEFLDLRHGASYFRRWHGYRKFSGSLLVTKASHHFDAVNWWLGSDPVEVIANGDLNMYGRNGSFRGIKCRGCPHQAKCKFYWDISQTKRYVDMYVNCESEDGYLRDACLYRDDLDTYDTNSVLVKYENGVQLTYTLTAASPYEGQRIVITGSEGRIMVRHYTPRQGWKVPRRNEIRLARNWKDPVMIYPEGKKGGHGGADPQLRDHVFDNEPADPLGQRAGSRAGIMSSMIGIVACESIESERRVRIKDLISLA